MASWQERVTNYVLGAWCKVKPVRGPFLVLVMLGISGGVVLGVIGTTIFFRERIEVLEATENQKSNLADEYLQKLQGASPEDAAQKIDRLEAKVAALETQEAERASMEWPSLSQEQIAAWTKKLFWHQGQITFLAIFYADTHSEALRASLREVFQKAGWPKPAVLGAGDREGIGIKAIPDNAAAAVLVALFRGAGYPVATLTPREHAPSKIQIYIGRRPLSHVRN